MKKTVAFIMFLCLCVSLLAGCGGEKKNSTGNNEIKELKIAVSPYQDAETVKTAVGPLSTMLQGKLKEKGFAVSKVSVSVGTSYSAVGEALSAGSADAGFVSGATYVLFDKEIDVLLTALRQGISKDTTDVKIWNEGEPEKFNDKLVQHYRSVLVTGPSAKGKAFLGGAERADLDSDEPRFRFGLPVSFLIFEKGIRENDC